MKTKIVYFDGLRVMACLMVITIHVFGFIAGHYAHLSTSTKILDAIVVSFSRAGVSLFFMVSGALMITNDANESIGYVLKRRFLKIVKLILIAGTLYLIGVIIYDDRHITSFVEVINGYTNNEFTHAMWFLYVLAGLYLCLPLLIVLKNKSEKYLWYLMFLVFFNVYLRELFSYLFGIKFLMEVPMATSFLGVFILGYFLNKYEWSPKATLNLTLLWLLALLIMILGTYTKSVSSNKLDTGLWENYNLLTLMMSTGLFVLAKNSRNFYKFAQNEIVARLSSLTLIVYIIHVFVLNILLKRVFDWDISKMHTKNFVVLWLLTVIISFALAFILAKLKSKISQLRNKNKPQVRIELAG